MTQASSLPLRGGYRFFCWCSGARLRILEQCPTEYNTFLGIGMIIFLTGMMDCLSGSYAFYTIFNNVGFAIAFGFFWGTLIFFLDWYLVGSLRKQNNVRNELLMSLPRFILAIFIGIVISKPIELKLFEKEINATIVQTELQTNLSNKKLIDSDFSDIERLRSDNESMALQLKSKEAQRNELFAMVVAEAEGRSATGKMGKGSVFREKKEALENIEVELKAMSAKFLPMIDANTKRISLLSEKRDVQLTKNKQITEKK